MKVFVAYINYGYEGYSTPLAVLSSKENYDKWVEQEHINKALHVVNPYGYTKERYEELLQEAITNSKFRCEYEYVILDLDDIVDLRSIGTGT